MGTKGIQYWVNGLRSNMVRQNLYSSVIHRVSSFIPIQTLKTLDLRYNYIGIEGVQDLACALKSNTIRGVF
jgi:hypothetical protein